MQTLMAERSISVRITTEKLFEKHSSKSYNPKLANAFFKSGMIEAWGRGFDKIKEACVKYDGRLPEYNISASGIMVLCKTNNKYLELLNGNENRGCPKTMID